MSKQVKGYFPIKLPTGETGKFWLRLTQTGRFVEIHVDLWSINYDFSQEAIDELRKIYSIYLNKIPPKEIYYCIGHCVLTIDVLRENMDAFLQLIKNKLENNLVSICENS